MVDPDETKRKGAAEALAATFKENSASSPTSPTCRQGQGDSDEWRGFKDVAAARHLSNRVEPEVVERWSPRCAPPIRACRIATTL
jgi:oligoendopeptidase F